MKYLETEQIDQTWQNLKNGKPEALSALFHQYYDVLFQYGLKLTHHNIELTKEIIQDVFFKLWERRASLGDVHHVKIYLFTAFRRILIDRSRHLKVEETHMASLNSNDFFVDSPEDAFLIEEKYITDTQKLRNAMLKLPKRIQEAITLRYFDEMEYTEIAQIMNLKERTVYNFVNEGLTFLRKALTIVALFSIALPSLISSCQKEEDYFNQAKRDLKEAALPTQYIGDWQWIGTWGGGWGGGTKPQANERHILTIGANKTYKSCKNDTCSTGRWFFGSRTIQGKYVDSLIVFDRLKVNNLFLGFGSHHLSIWQDTLTVSALCNDCDSPHFVRK